MGVTWQYYDLVLLGIGLSLALGAAAGIATSLSIPLAVSVAALVAAAIIGHGLFVNGPVDTVEDLAAEIESLN